MDIVQPTLSATLVVLIYVLIDKVVVPLISRKDKNGKQLNGYSATYHDGQRKLQEQINAQLLQRLEGIEEELRGFRVANSDIKTTLAVASDNLRRITEILDAKK